MHIPQGGLHPILDPLHLWQIIFPYILKFRWTSWEWEWGVGRWGVSVYTSDPPLSYTNVLKLVLFFLNRFGKISLTPMQITISI